MSYKEYVEKLSHLYSQLSLFVKTGNAKGVSMVEMEIEEIRKRFSNGEEK